ncbi:hypothetical protein L207DRAFT_517428 [Hyaloscypha variabilis F]|uniref:Uncharacterized protein n=1 Tax=Hyaloscypha variabilis (strain UAMH 11265 / GT02V1 / F) TaxID=1149755 RepID=A0A2J6R6T4_HYAVF|nr:hypothetical protein L207DRAFT_517428 [Hyaloscypha variabilis F]
MVYKTLVLRSSVNFYLHDRRGTQVLLSSILRVSDNVPGIDPSAQWIREVKSWFEVGFLRARFTMLSILEGEGRRPQEPDPTDPLDSLRMCDRILFFDDNYTNIDFAGLIATLLTLLVLCMISYTKEAKVAYKKFASAGQHRFEEARPAL